MWAHGIGELWTLVLQVAVTATPSMNTAASPGGVECFPRHDHGEFGHGTMTVAVEVDVVSGGAVSAARTRQDRWKWD